ncbi:MAG TPA: VOC family protein [Burkholderiales bacterium]|nr:VOC family protein [Burkholderiales bacterium]
MDPGRPHAHARHRAAREDPGGVAAVLTRIDHVAIGVADLKAGIAAYRRIGFEVDDLGVGRNDGDRLRLVTPGDGLKSIALASNNLAADSAAVRARGTAQYLTLVAPKNGQAASPHPNGVQRIERVYIAVRDIAAAAAMYSLVLGVPKPKMERGTVINADMAIFQFGPTALGLAQPCAPGVCADALARRGPGPFQILYRTSSMDAAAKWMSDHGVPPPARGIRNTGEQAMLVAPEHACGVYIGFVGPA